jgi:hypothetical protein
MKKLLLGMVALLSIFFATSCGGPKTPGEIAKYYTEKMYKGDIEEVLEAYVNPPEGEKKDQLVALVKGKLEKTLEKKEGLSEVKIMEEKIAEDGETARVKLEVIFGDGSKDHDTMRLKKVDGDWKINEKLF